MPTAESILKDFGDKLVTDVRAKLRSKGVTFGGGQDSKLAANTTFDIGATGLGIEFRLKMPQEWYWVNKGRDPGPVSKAGRKGMAEWAKRKAIIGEFQAKNLQARITVQSESKSKLAAGKTRSFKQLKKLPFEKAVDALTFLVARSVTKNGYEPTFFLDELLKDGRVDKLRKDIGEQTRKDIIINFNT